MVNERLSEDERREVLGYDERSEYKRSVLGYEERLMKDRREENRHLDDAIALDEC